MTIVNIIYIYYYISNYERYLSHVIFPLRNFCSDWIILNVFEVELQNKIMISFEIIYSDSLTLFQICYLSKRKNVMAKKLEHRKVTKIQFFKIRVENRQSRVESNYGASLSL